MKIATWNLKYAVAPRVKVPILLDWSEQNIDADVYAFTESNLTSTTDMRWKFQWNPEGVYPDKSRKWGTTLATTRINLRPVSEVRSGIRTIKLIFDWPAAVQVADLEVGGEIWGTLVGIYGVTRGRNGEDNKSGAYSIPRLLSQLEPLLESKRADRLVVAGDFNLWPGHVVNLAKSCGLVDLVEKTASTRMPLENCWNCKFFSDARTSKEICGHLFTHRNGRKPIPGGKPFGGMVQQIDFVWASQQLARKVVKVFGGEQSFPDIWNLSDHAPIVVEFENL